MSRRHVGRRGLSVAWRLEDGVACGDQALRTQKALLRSWEELPLSQALQQSIAAFGRAFTTGEPQKYMQAFLDRPRPKR